MSDLNENKINDIEILRKEIQITLNEINSDIDNRIDDYFKSLLYKYYNSLFYYLPKHCLIDIQNHNHINYSIAPDQKFFIHDKKNNNDFKYTTRLQTNILPIKNVYTEKSNDNLVIALDFNKNIDYDEFCIWVNPSFSKQNPYIADYIINKITSLKTNEIQAKIVLSNGETIISSTSISKLKYDIPLSSIIAMRINSIEMVSAFNIKLIDLFKYNYSEIISIKIFIKLNLDDIIPVKNIQNLFKLNLIPLYNLYDDYSSNTYADISLSNISIQHFKNKSSIPIYIYSIYENNKKIDFNGYYFSGVNEYYFDFESNKLNYNVIMPNLNSDISNIKVSTFAQWTQNLDISEFTEIKSSFISSKNSIILTNNNYSSNIGQNTHDIYSLIDKLNSHNIFSKTTFKITLVFLKVSNDKISQLMELIEEVKLNNEKTNIIIKTTPLFLKEDEYFMNFFFSIFCDFINQNTHYFIAWSIDYPYEY